MRELLEYEHDEHASRPRVDDNLKFGALSMGDTAGVMKVSAHGGTNAVPRNVLFLVIEEMKNTVSGEGCNKHAQLRTLPSCKKTYGHSPRTSRRMTALSAQTTNLNRTTQPFCCDIVTRQTWLLLHNIDTTPLDGGTQLASSLFSLHHRRHKKCPYSVLYSIVSSTSTRSLCTSFEESPARSSDVLLFFSVHLQKLRPFCELSGHDNCVKSGT
jgi:hypothetical protein